ncbi:hypothetical protein [Paraburkholderia antibiotica]|uniref:Uncharacterized protein n=1 Tax=Paraburkholderia antibiotica TaxID=2728839 RepID=A0A7Y0A1L9_9BURK|nr:hypothetical protein [Paraburkholderia antibiotica]NML34842.1 hypothetical protein [Paraburkholderia antibiotica]
MKAHSTSVQTSVVSVNVDEAGCQKFNPDIKSSNMKRPAIVTGIACLNLMGVLSALWLYDTKGGVRIGSDPLFIGSVLPIRWQWNLVTASTAVSLLTTIGLFRGWNWARWLALALIVLFYIVTVPVRDVHMLPSYFFTLAGSTLTFSLLFFSPVINRYFARPAEEKRKLTIRGIIGMTLFVFTVFTLHSIVRGLFWRTLSVEVAWIGLGLFVLPALLLSLLVRWHLEVSLREISALLLAVPIFFVNQLAGWVLVLHFAYSAVLLRYPEGLLQRALFMLALGAGGLLLAVYVARRYRITPADGSKQVI